MKMSKFYFPFVILFLFSCAEADNSENKESRFESETNFIEIPHDVLIDKVRGGLLGQIIGNLNGLPHEFQYNEEPGNVTDYIPALPDGAYTDDDTDIEWVYVYNMQKHNELFLSPDVLADIWKESFNQRIWCSNGYVRRLLDIGIKPPLTGKLALNPWAEFNISGQFICETFGLICPAMPQSAARLGLNYTKVTIDAEPAQTTQMFTTMIATAFIENDINKILDAGYASLDPSSKVRVIIDDIKKWHEENPNDWRKTRKLLQEKYTQAGGTLRDGNGYELITGATIASFLYGQGDFVKTIQTGMNFGWDCDNTTATLGTILGIQMGYKNMMSQGWKIVDRYKNISRDEMPEDETITSFADRVYELMEKMIVHNGGKRILRDGKYFFQIPVENPATVEKLPELDDQITELASDLRPEIESEIKAPESKETLCKAVYLAICLELNTELAQKYPIQWTDAIKTFEECWKLKQLIFHGGDFPSILRMKEKFLQAGITAPEVKIALPVIWQDKRICLSPGQVLELKREN
jgi:ADP-ribosylglycohydrolase